jgi:hypothetical protein
MDFPVVETCSQAVEAKKTGNPDDEGIRIKILMSQ